MNIEFLSHCVRALLHICETGVWDGTSTAHFREAQDLLAHPSPTDAKLFKANYKIGNTCGRLARQRNIGSLKDPLLSVTALTMAYCAERNQAFAPSLEGALGDLGGEPLDEVQILQSLAEYIKENVETPEDPVVTSATEYPGAVADFAFSDPVPKEPTARAARYGLPDQDAIGKLPELARVALAARYARRVQVFFDLPGNDKNEDHIAAVNSAIESAEIVASGVGEPAADAAELAADGAAEVAVDGAAKHAAYVAADAAEAADEASYAGTGKAVANTAEVLTVVDPEPWVWRMFANDYTVLVTLASRENWEDTSPVDHWAVVGPLWPEGPPQDWPEYRASIQAAIPPCAVWTRIDFLEHLVNRLRADVDSERITTSVIAAVAESLSTLELEISSARTRLRTHDSELKQLRQKSEEWQVSFGDATEEAQGLRARVTSSGKAIVNLESMVKEVEKKTETAKSSVERAINDAVSAARLEVAADDAIKYWDDRQVSHATRATKWQRGLAVVAVLGLFILVCLLRWFHDEYRAEVANTASVSASSAKSGVVPATSGSGVPWYLGVSLLCGTVFLLGLRVISRVAMSHLHLSNEAEERAVMARTYLTLHKMGEIPNEQRTLMLQALFRPSTTGLVKDDAVPPSVLDLATRSMKGV